MKRILLVVLLAGWALFSSAQPAVKPKWIDSRPVASNETFYYRVTIGEGGDYDQAYANAFAKAILESSWKMGVPVNNEDDLKTIEERVYDNITIEKSQMNIPMNKVCEYVENLSTKTGVRMYILWQVASFGDVVPLFDDYNICE